MKKRNLILVLIAFLVIITGVWSVLVVHAYFSSGPATSRNGTNPTAPYRTGTLVIPTVKVSTSATNCDPQHIPGVASDPAHGIGGPAIKPHLCDIPTFTEQDVRKYMSTVSSFNGLHISQTSPSYTITRILFVTNEVANAANGLNADTGVTDPHLIVCYVEVYGDFRIAGGPRFPSQSRSTPTPQPAFHHGEMVFDGITGNVLTTGIMP